MYHCVCLQLVEAEELSATQAHTFLRSSQRSIDLVEKYFRLSSPLYFDYTHLVCRTARNGKYTRTWCAALPGTVSTRTWCAALPGTVSTPPNTLF